MSAAGSAIAGEISFAPAVNYAAGHPSTKVAVADMNGDGFPDIVVNNDGAGIGRFVLLLNDGTGAFGPPLSFGDPDGAALAVGDLDGDGDIDVVTSSSPRNYWYENDGSANFTEHRFRQSSFRATSIALCDYDGDGDNDVGLVTPLGDVEIATNLGGGDFAHFVSKRLFEADSCCAYPTSIDAVDLRGDGASGFVVASHAKRSFIRIDWLGGRDFDPVVMQNVGRPDAVAYGELDGSPGIDVVFTHNAVNAESPSRGLWVGCNDGFGRFVVCERLRQTLDVQSPEAVAVGDFDGDGRDELVVSNTFFSLTVVVAARDDTGVWSVATEDYCGGGAVAIAIADLNHDGRPDIVVANYVQDVGVLINTGGP